MRMWPTGTHTARAWSATPFVDGDLIPEDWGVDYTDDVAALFGPNPEVVAVTLVDANTLDVGFDASLGPGVSYVVDAPVTSSVVLLGPKRHAARERSPAEFVLLDIDAPIIRGDRRGGDYTLSPGGDYALSAGLATVEKAIWARLLTTRGELYWSPDFGSPLRHKSLRSVHLRDEQSRLEKLVEAIPYVTRAVVQLLWGSGQMAVSVRAETDFGKLDTRREVSDGA